jgi:hypothetical protein
MQESKQQPSSHPTTFSRVQITLRQIARICALVWASWWTLFVLIAGILEGSSITSILFITGIAGLICLGSVAIAWKWPAPGGILFSILCVLTFVVSPYTGSLPAGLKTLLILTLHLPPLFAGILFIVSWWKPLKRWIRKDEE